MSDRLEKAKEQLDLHDWLSSYADMKAGGGSEFRIKDCPKCGDDKYKLYVNTEKQLWICYVCEWGRGIRDVVNLMSYVSGRSTTSVRLELLSFVPPAPSGDIYGLLDDAFDGKSDYEEDETEFETIELPGVPGFNGITSRKVRNYAVSRGLTTTEIARFALRPASTLPTTKSKKEIRGPFLVVPVVVGGRPVSWQGRKIDNSLPKYISSSNVKDWLFPLDEEFLTMYSNAGRVLYIVEGTFDAMGMARLGFPAVCTFGTSVSNKQIALLRDLAPTRICFAWDTGASAHVARTVSAVSRYFPETYISITDHPAGKKIDAGDALKSQEAVAWIRKISDNENLVNVGSPEFFTWRMENA